MNKVRERKKKLFVLEDVLPVNASTDATLSRLRSTNAILTKIKTRD